MFTVCEKNMCNGCMACISVCSKNAISINDNCISLNAIIDPQKCVNCGLCKKTCPNNTFVNRNEPNDWFQGWAKSDGIRNKSASGGIASAIASEFIRSGGYVCSCVFSKGSFVFICTNKIEEVQRFAGSKYVKSNPINVYKTVQELLKLNNKILVIALPCQVAGFKAVFKQNENIYFIDLICHGTPSIKILDRYLADNGIDLRKINHIQFRNKSVFGIIIGNNPNKKTVADPYTISFLNAVNYTENCYSCQYATLERLSDLTLGDNWGTELKSELKKGVSLILCNTNKGRELLNRTDLELHNVNRIKAITANGQLTSPASKPTKQRIEFYSNIKKGKKYNKIIRRLYPKQSFRQIIKSILYALNIKK